MSQRSRGALHPKPSTLQGLLHDNDIIIPEQFGFRAKHSTTHQLLLVVKFVSEGLQRQEASTLL